MLDRFQDEGAADYVAFASRIGESVRLGEGEGIMASWSTDAPEGFSDAQIQLLAGIMPPLTLVFMLRTMNRTARTLIQTYLGSDAAERVLAGNIVRGRADPIRAVVWFSDLVGFTRISDTSSPGTVLELLNDYAEAQVEEIEAQGGHVLKFIGDGILAIFPQHEMAQACAACARCRDQPDEPDRDIERAPRSPRHAGHRAHIALHVGELLYGNLGSPRRLDFTVLGPAVNEAARIESFCALARADRHRVDGVRGSFGPGAAPAGQRRSLCDEGRRPAAGTVHAGSCARACRARRKDHGAVDSSAVSRRRRAGPNRGMGESCAPGPTAGARRWTWCSRAAPTRRQPRAGASCR